MNEELRRTFEARVALIASGLGILMNLDPLDDRTGDILERMSQDVYDARLVHARLTGMIFPKGRGDE